MKSLIIVGAGGHGRVVLDAAEAAFGLLDWPIAGFVDDLTSGPINGFPVLGPTELLSSSLLNEHCFVVAVGDQDARRTLSSKIRDGGGELVTIVHPDAWVSPNATIGEGTVVVGGVIVNANASVGDFCILNTACSVDHDCRLADGVQICPGVRLAGNVSCGEDVFIGTGAVVTPRVAIGAKSIVGAGSLVLRDVPAGTKVFGLVN